MTEKILIVIESPNQLRKLQSTKYKLSKHEDFSQKIIIANEPEVQKYLIYNNIPFKTLYNYSSNTELTYIREQLKFIEKTFFKVDETVNKNFSVGKFNYGFLFAYDIGYYLQNVIKTSLTIFRCIKKEKPNRVICFRSNRESTSIRTDENDSSAWDILNTVFINEEVKVEKIIIKASSGEGKKSSVLGKFVRAYFSITNFFRIKKKESVLFFNTSGIKLGDTTERLLRNGINCIFEPFPYSNTYLDSLFQHLRFFPRLASSKFSYLKSRSETKLIRDLNQKFENMFEILASHSNFTNYFSSCLNNLPEIEKLKLWLLLRKKLKFIFEKEFIKLFLEHDRYNRLFGTLNLRAIIIHDEETVLCKLVSLIAKYKEIKTLHLFHGYYDQYSLDMNKTDHNADIQCVWGRKLKNEMVKLGYPEKGIRITGNPAYDKYFQNIHRDNYFHLKDGKINEPYIIFATSWYRRDIQKVYRDQTFEGFYKVLSALADTLKSFPTIKLVLKLHPGDQNSDTIYKQLLEKLRIKNYSIIRKVNIIDLISSSLLLVTLGFSTLSIDGLILGKTVINTDFMFPYLQTFSSYLDIHFINSSNHLDRFLRKYIKNYHETNVHISNRTFKDLDYVVAQNSHSSAKMFEIIRDSLTNQ